MNKGMNFSEALHSNAKARMGKEGPKVLKSIEHEESENGGHMFTHRFESNGMGYKEPETHTFGKDEGRKALEHFAKHAGLSEHLEPASEEKGETKAEEEEE